MIEEQIDLSLLHGVIDKDKFVSLVEFQAENYKSKNTIFYIVAIDFKIKKYKEDQITAENVAKYISAVIHATVNPAFDCYTYCNNKFIVLLTGGGVNSIQSFMKKIDESVENKFKDEVEVNYGHAQCPQDSTNCKDLVQYSLNTRTIKSELSGIHSKAWGYEVSKSLKTIESNMKSQLFNELTTLVKLIDGYDSYLSSHSQKVAQGSVILAQELGIADNVIEKIAIASLLHDIGYIAIAKEVYNKKGNLSQEEWNIIRLHPLIASEHILKPYPIFQEYLPIITNHHEFLGGSGYPKGKKGYDVPIESQIISIVDTYRAICVDRPYRKAFDVDEIFDLYIRSAGIKWDKNLITIFTAVIADVEMKAKFDASGDFDLKKFLK